MSRLTIKGEDRLASEKEFLYQYPVNKRSECTNAIKRRVRIEVSSIGLRLGTPDTDSSWVGHLSQDKTPSIYIYYSNLGGSRNKTEKTCRENLERYEKYIYILYNFVKVVVGGKWTKRKEKKMLGVAGKVRNEWKKIEEEK